MSAAPTRIDQQATGLSGKDILVPFGTLDSNAYWALGAPLMLHASDLRFAVYGPKFDAWMLRIRFQLRKL